MNRRQIKQIAAFFKRTPEVVLAYLFGSTVSGKQHAGSDVDIAVLFEWEPEFEAILEMRGALEDIVHKDVDIILFHSAPPVLRMQVINKGKELFCRDQKTKFRFIINAFNEYEDLKYYQNRFHKNLLEKPILA